MESTKAADDFATTKVEDTLKDNTRHRLTKEITLITIHLTDLTPYHKVPHLVMDSL